MKQLSDRFKTSWNILLNLGLLLSVLITGFIVPPRFSTDLVEATIDYTILSKFVLAIIAGLFLVPALLYKQKKHCWRWWVAACVFLIGAFIAFFNYYTVFNSKTVILVEAGQNVKNDTSRIVIGDHLLPNVKGQTDSLGKALGGTLTNEEIIINSSGAVQDIWPMKERQRNCMRLIFCYLLSLILFGLAALAAVQAIYCADKEQGAERQEARGEQPNKERTARNAGLHTSN